MINNVTLIGNLGMNPEVKQLQGDNVVANFSLATNESYKDKQGEWQTITQWHNITAWGNQAKYAEKYLEKGSKIYLEGKIRYEKYTDKDNNERTATKIIANSIKGLDKREQTGVVASPATAASMPSKSDDFDDLPF